MTKLETLFSLLANHPKLNEAAKCKALIEAHPKWLEDYQTMLALQKRLVRETVDHSSHAEQTKEAIDRLLERLENTPAVGQYLDALNDLQEDFDAVAQILNQELNRQ
jgi:cell fate (sporulation/competence/biofilm development) regulator YmcA (YheA/YmcA/DUF963 family)